MPHYLIKLANAFLFNSKLIFHINICVSIRTITISSFHYDLLKKKNLQLLIELYFKDFKSSFYADH